MSTANIADVTYRASFPNIRPEDYLDPSCVLCGKPGEPETVRPVPVGRILDKLAEYERKNDRNMSPKRNKYCIIALLFRLL